MFKKLEKLSDPTWLRDLDLEEPLRAEVRAKALELLKRDRTFLQWVTESDPEREARRVRARLGGGDGIGPRLARIISRIIVGLQIPILIAGPLLLIPSNVNWLVAVLFVVWGALFFLTLDSRWLDRQVLTPHYATVLRDHGIVACLKCGYHAANLAPEPICSECGLKDPLAR